MDIIVGRAILIIGWIIEIYLFAVDAIGGLTCLLLMAVTLVVSFGIAAKINSQRHPGFSQDRNSSSVRKTIWSKPQTWQDLVNSYKK